MELTNKQIKALRNELKAMRYSLEIRQEPGKAWGYIKPLMRKMMIVNKVKGYHTYTDATGYKHTTRNHDPRKTLAHEYTHILQDARRLYYPSVRHASINEIYNYNEIVANTVGMLCFPTDDNIIDNAGYVNRYLAEGTGDLLKHLKNDINELLPLVEEFLQKIGLK